MEHSNPDCKSKTPPAKDTFADSNGRPLDFGDRSFRLFSESIPNDETWKGYSQSLGYFMQDMKAKAPDALLCDPFNRRAAFKLQAKVEDWLIAKKTAGKVSSARTYFAAVKKFYVQNDIILNWDKLSGLLTESKANTDDIEESLTRPYTLKEITDMLAIANEREKALIFWFLGAAPRVGGLKSFNLNHMLKVKMPIPLADGTAIEVEVYAVMLYGGRRSITEWLELERWPKHVYVTFLFPEATKAADRYLALRKLYGDPLDGDEPFMIARFDRHDKKSAYKHRYDRITAGDARQMIRALAVRAGVLDLSKNVNKERGFQYDVQPCHGFRKYTITQMAKPQVGMSETYRNMLTDHTAGLDDIYVHPPLADLWVEYRKAIPYLTIDQGPALESAVVKQVETRFEERIAELESGYNMVLEQFAGFVEQAEKAGLKWTGTSAGGIHRFANMAKAVTTPQKLT